jgi:uncharacterized protein (TIGR04255 family)
MPDQPQFEPLHQAHAIDQVALILNFQRPLDARVLRAARDAVGNPEDLPARAELRAYALQVGPNMIPAGAAVAGPALVQGGAAPLAGFSFTRMRPDGSEEIEFQVQRHQVSFRTVVYTRWAKVFAQAQKLLEKVLPVFLSYSPITAIAMNYADKFVCLATPGECDARRLLRKDSPYLAPSVFEAKDLWHCHTGAFSRPDEQTKRLITVNADLLSDRVEEKDRTVLSITSILTDGFNNPGYSPTELKPDAGPDFVFRRFDALHALDKIVLGSIIVPSLAKRIALEQ